jgi:alpha/beta superfamily hydrolase
MPTSITTAHAPITFQAVWNEKNQHLSETCVEKITRTVFFFLNKFIAGLVLPATLIRKNVVSGVCRHFEQRWDPRTHPHSLLTQNFTPSPIEVTTPDGVKLRGTFFKNAAAQESAPTVVFYQPNAMIGKQGTFDWVMEQAALQEFPYNFVYFDYRGCGESDQVTPNSKKDLFLDGESIYQFVRDKLHVPAKEIHFYGWSLGGGISANVKQIHSEREGKYVNERSFTSINETLKNMTSHVLAAIAGIAISAMNWNIDAVEPIKKMKGKTLIVHHPEDELMRKQASLYHRLFERGVAPSPNITELNLSQGQDTPYFLYFHGAPIAHFVHQEFHPEHQIAKFLFSSNCSFSERMLNRFAVATPEFRNRVFSLVARSNQNGGRYWGSGEDAFYNRNGLSMTDEDRMHAICLAKGGN